MYHNTRGLLIGAVDTLQWDDIKLWVNSIRRTDFSGDIFVIGYRMPDGFAVRCKAEGVTLIRPEADFQNRYLDYRPGTSANFVCQRRFFHLWQVLDEVVNNYDVVIHTDTRDVVFQRNPLEWWHANVISTSDLVKSSEGIQYQHEDWGKQDVISAFGPYVYESVLAEQTIGNAGSMMGYVQTMRDFALNVFNTAYGHPEAADQAAVNLLLATAYKHAYTTGTVANGWSAQCGTLLDPTKLHYRPHLVDEVPQVNYTTGQVTNSEGNEVVLVHQYHRVPLLNQAIHKRFG